MPSAYIIIPAFNEGKVIDRCLDALAGADAHVVVVANGCIDDTARRARARVGVEVIEIATASKIAALNAGDAACGGLSPRIYLDADIQLSRDHAERLTRVLRSASDPLVCAPTASFELSGASRAVRMYYSVYQRLPYINEGMIGSGVYAVNAAGRGRWGAFPEIIADDLYVQGRFATDERKVVAGTSFTITVPRTLRGLLNVRTRTYRGNRQAVSLAVAGTMAGSRSGSLRAVLELCRHEPRLIASTIVYLGLNAVAAGRARADQRQAWLTDTSSRE